MKILSSIEIQAVVKELQIFVNARVDQIYQPDSTEIVLALHRSDIGKKFVRLIPGTALYIASKRRPSPQESINFCRFLRKRLGPTKCKEIIQKNKERIVEFHFEGKESYFILIVEFFSKGNLILCEKDYTIVSAMQMQVWKDRKIKAKIKYEYPPARKTDFEDENEFQTYLQENKKESIVKTLALGINVGGVYAEEICARAQVNKETKDPSKEEIKKIYHQWKLLQEENLSPNTLNNEPYPFQMKSRGQGTPCASYNEALDHYYAQFIDETTLEEKERPQQKKKYELMVEEQEKQKLQIEKAIEENQRKGEFIYEHYMEIKEILDAFKQKNVEFLKKKGVEIEGKNLVIELT